MNPGKLKIDVEFMENKIQIFNSDKACSTELK